MPFSWRRVVHASEKRLHEFNSKCKIKFLSATSQRAYEKYIIHKLLTNNSGNNRVDGTVKWFRFQEQRANLGCTECTCRLGKITDFSCERTRDQRLTNASGEKQAPDTPIQSMKFIWRRVVDDSEEGLHEFNSKCKMKFLSATSQTAREKYIIHKLLTNTHSGNNRVYGTVKWSRFLEQRAN